MLQVVGRVMSIVVNSLAAWLLPCRFPNKLALCILSSNPWKVAKTKGTQVLCWVPLEAGSWWMLPNRVGGGLGYAPLTQLYSREDLQLWEIKSPKPQSWWAGELPLKSAIGLSPFAFYPTPWLLADLQCFNHTVKGQLISLLLTSKTHEKPSLTVGRGWTLNTAPLICLSQLESYP